MIYDHSMNKSEMAKVRSSGPDVCWTPCGASEKPVPYTSTAYAIQSENASSSVRVNGVWNLKYDSVIPRSTGTEGATRGVKSNKPICGEARPEKHCGTVRSDSGIPLIRHEQSWTINNENGMAEAAHKSGSAASVVSIDVDKPSGFFGDIFDGEHQSDDALEARAKEIGDADGPQKADVNADGTFKDGSSLGDLSNSDTVEVSIHHSELQLIGPERLAQMLKDAGFKGSSVRLVSCEASEDAKELARHLPPGTNVISYDRTVLYKNGKIFVEMTLWEVPLKDYHKKFGNAWFRFGDVHSDTVREATVADEIVSTATPPPVVPPPGGKPAGF